MGKSIKLQDRSFEQVHYSDLDSARFRIRVARSKLSDRHLPLVLDWCEDNDIDLLIVRVLRASEHYRTFVADLDGELVGFSTLKLTKKRQCEVVLSGVSPWFRRRGVFRSMHEYRLDWCRSIQVKRLHAFTAMSNVPISQSYEAAGFVPIQHLATFHRWFR